MARKRRAVVGRGDNWRIEWETKEYQTALEKHLARNAQRVGQFMAGKVKQKLSKGQPTRRTSGARGGRKRLVGTTRATAGAPPRVLEGRLRQSIDFQIVRKLRSVQILLGAFAKYALRHELGYPKGHQSHPYLRPTIRENIPKIVKLFSQGSKRKKLVR